MIYRNSLILATALALLLTIYADTENNLDLPLQHAGMPLNSSQSLRRVKRLSTPSLTDETRELAKYCVSIRSRTPRKYFGDNHYCGGTIISPNFILSAAHCVMDKRKIMHRARVLLVVAGTPNRLTYVKGQSVNMPVKKLYVPKNFTMYNTNNIALIELKSALPTGNPAIGIAQLPTKEPQYNVNYTVLGWGRVYFGGPMASHILQIDVELLTQKFCSKMLKSFKSMMMCAGNLDNGLDENPCAGDTGGPMMKNKTVYGVVSYRLGCGSITLPSVYTNVFQHIDWIKDTMARGSCTVESQYILILLAITLLNCTFPLLQTLCSHFCNFNHWKLCQNNFF